MRIFVDYLKLFVFSKIIWINCGLFVKKCSIFQVWSRLFEFLRNRGLFALFEIILDHCKLFVDFLFGIFCGLFETWIIADYGILLHIICGLFVDYL